MSMCSYINIYGYIRNVNKYLCFDILHINRLRMAAMILDEYNIQKKLKVAITNSARYTTVKERYEWIFLTQIVYL